MSTLEPAAEQPQRNRGIRMSAYSPPPQGPTPHGPAPYGQPGQPGQPGPTPYGPPAGQGGPVPYGSPPGGALPYGQQPAYGQPPFQQQPGVPMFTPTGPARRPWLRPLIALGAVIVVGSGFWVLNTVLDDGKPPTKVARDARVGDCLENRGTHANPDLYTIACGDAKADYKVMIDATLRHKCPAEFDEYTERGGTSGETTLCLTAVRH
ncbi:hypothetical protein ACH4CC_20875 [Streptomyces lydicus]|uniref:LppU/SCO3897 family protein n=1 Tax=Streptomyces lydicus TaxID=47763 RepID=UPI0037893629